ncbi:IS91 family transposase [Marinobacterium aestuariivivens]|uniref:IS91 family transposase n=1 Tax=Marinobacterium aestuariivivens TaxID=1698799 RepID=A0ABW2A5H5_9GAMM
MTDQPTMAAIMARFLAPYQERCPLAAQQARACHSICCCRTEALGGQSWGCNRCGYHEIRFHSFRNHHCPQCQQQASQQWLEDRQQDLLSVPYFHLVFTLPHSLNDWVQCHPAMLYDLLFKSVWTTLKTFGEDPKRLDGELGMTAVLHTWSQNLTRHVHLHCLVPGGALSKQGDAWHPAKSNYLFPVRALSRYFRGEMVRRLRQAYSKGLLPKVGDARALSAKLDELMVTDWVVYSKAYYQNSKTVLTYLARYTHRIAISQGRLVEMDEQSVRFAWKDYRDRDKRKVMELSGIEFIRRFLLHVLPAGFMWTRHLGFMANCHRRKKLTRIRDCLQQQRTEIASQEASDSVPTKPPAPMMIEPSPPQRCPRCGQGHLQFYEEVSPQKARTMTAA